MDLRVDSELERKVERMSKILIGCPTFGIDKHPGKWLNSLLQIVLDLNRVGITYGFCFPYRKSIHKAENTIIRTALTNKYTHILRLDDDVWGIQPGDIIKLLRADKDFISAVMFIRGFPYSRCAFRKTYPEMSYLECERRGQDAWDEVDGDGVQPVDLTAFPFTLFKTSIYDRMTHPYFDAENKLSPDAAFCEKCKGLGIQPYAHMDVQINHEDVTPWNRLFLFNAAAREMLMTRKIDPTRGDYELLKEMFGEDGLKDLYILKETGREPKIDSNNSPE